MNYQDLTKEEIDKLKILLEEAERNNQEEIVFQGITLDFEYASLLYNICINETISKNEH